ncbi:MAG TPA: hypothetical protein H9956_10805 [Candidatus Eisenbergiella pullicola]|nr:hypothetical protein [Candidatus Eisenbergiella pullicola]
MNCLYLLVLLCCCNWGKGRGSGCCGTDNPYSSDGCMRSVQEGSCGCGRDSQNYGETRQGCCPDTVPEMNQPAVSPYPIYPDHCGCNNR